MIKILFNLFSHLPHRAAKRLAVVLGHLFFWLPNREKNIATINIARCFPELSSQAQQQLVKQTLIDNVNTLLELPRIFTKGGDYALSLIQSVHGQQHYDAALQSGNGVILLAPHLGNWEITIHYFNQFSPMTAMFAPPKQAFLYDILQQARESTGAKLVPTNITGIRALMKTLKNGGAIGILPDQQPKAGQGGVFADFMGHSALTMTLVSQLLQRQSATVLFVFAKRVANGYDIHILPAPEGLDHKDERLAATALNQGVAACVHLAPSQYQWTYKRFHRQPNDEQSPYENAL